MLSLFFFYRSTLLTNFYFPFFFFLKINKKNLKKKKKKNKQCYHCFLGKLAFTTQIVSERAFITKSKMAGGPEKPYTGCIETPSCI